MKQLDHPIKNKIIFTNYRKHVYTKFALVRRTLFKFYDFRIQEVKLTIFFGSIYSIPKDRSVYFYSTPGSESQLTSVNSMTETLVCSRKFEFGTHSV